MINTSHDLHTDFALRLRKLLELRSPEIRSHLSNVARYAEVLAREIGWSESRIAMIKYAAPLHDLGKLLVPRRILEKTARLDADEFAEVKTHPVVGWEVLSGSDNPLFDMAAKMARHHHERWDGQGYPDGLSGENIPEEARLLAVSDVYDSLSSDRCYRDALDQEFVLNYLKTHSGTIFDPKMVEAFLKLYNRGEIVGFI